jgi:phenylacetate-CoA ligase
MTTFFDAAEAMSRKELGQLQEDRLLEQVPYVYERSALFRSAWEDAAVTPKDISSLDDFRARAPFVDKDTIRRFRSRTADPFGGLLCVPPAEADGIGSSSGTSGEPTPAFASTLTGIVKMRNLWEMGVRSGDYVTSIHFTFRHGGTPTPPQTGRLATIPIYLNHSPDEVPHLIEASRRYRPTTLEVLTNPLILWIEAYADEHRIDLREAFSSYKAVVFGGEPLSPRAQHMVEDVWGLELRTITGVGDVTAAYDCAERAGCHVAEDVVLIENLHPETLLPVGDGERGELVVTALGDQIAPLIRYRSGDLVIVTTEPCGCGRTLARVQPLGRAGDELIVQGRSVLPMDVWAAVESVPATQAGLFQIIRAERTADVLRLRVGYDAADHADVGATREALLAALAAAVGVPAEVDLVPNDQLLALGPPHKIPRVTSA